MVNFVEVSGETLSSDDFAKGDFISCSLTPHDGVEGGVSVSSAAVEVANSPPTLGTAAFANVDGPFTDTLLWVETSGWADEDGDPEGYLYSWTVNGAAAGGDEPH